MKHTVAHDLDVALAQRAVKIALTGYAERFEQFSPQVNWMSEARADIGFKAKGVAVTGQVDVLPGKILIDLEVPFLLRVFKKKAIHIIEREIRAWIEKARNGELEE
jgi:hypothetical protein